MENNNKFPPIGKYYENRDIFVTGATGIMGKVLIEKILRSCPKVNKIFLLLRSRKEQTLEQRITKLKSSMVFDRLKKENPGQLNKLIPIYGDITKLKLDIGEQDCDCMRNVSIIFHLAASIRFDDPMKQSILINLRGTREVLELATEKFKKLEVFIHTSTAYSNPHIDEIEEKLYPVASDWRKMIKMAETMDEEELNAISTKLLNEYPNTYTLTKGLAEHCVMEYKDKLPLVIFRPSIVISSLEEPFPGWFDAFVGPVGLLTATATGICRCIFAKSNNVLDYMPVDVAIKALILSACERSQHTPKNDAIIINCSSTNHKAVNLTEGFYSLIETTRDFPCNKMIWLPNISIEPNHFIYILKVVLFQLTTAIFLDSLIWIAGQKPMIMRLQRHLFASQKVHEFFVFKEYNFKNDGFTALEAKITKWDMADFGFMHTAKYQMTDLSQIFATGVRKFLLKEDDGTIERAKIVYKILYGLDRIIKMFVLYYICRFLYVKYNL